LLKKHPPILTALSTTFDIWAAGNWHSLVRLNSKTDDEVEGVDLSSDRVDVDLDVIRFLRRIPSRPTSSGQTFPHGEVRVTVRQVELQLLARDALALREHPEVLLADMTNDLVAAYADRAAYVHVSRMPNAFLESLTLQGRLPHASSVEAEKPASTENPVEIMDTNRIVLFLPFISLSAANTASNAAIRAINGDGWQGTDSGREFGLSYPGNDDPDSGWKFRFAPMSNWHDMWWYNYDEPTWYDWVYDEYLNWYDGSRTEPSASAWFGARTYYNLAHEIRVGRVYEAYNGYWTNLPNIDHSEDSTELEEWYDGYEELEVGTSKPETLNVGRNYWVHTAWQQQSTGGDLLIARFEAESELAGPGRDRPPCSPWTQWCPYAYDLLGNMTVYARGRR
jgi:hypothetical protein